METYTPGPWHLSGNWYLTTSTGKMLTFQTVVGNSRKVAGVMMDTREIDSFDEMQADAKLIAAAPELLEACKRSLAEFERHSPLTCEGCISSKSLLSQAITEAEGKEVP